ncbi:hypothetical protein JOY44_29780, partial (plasmid) [Phormidium sp. CLA17]|uniref:hypothetical protein n=1 Tax=Leptolyngbya sp. Cla-17 TaxID=2803751 RepID=UPI001490AEFC
DDKSSNVMVVHVAARLNGAFEKIIKESCTKGSWKNAKTIFLSEYGYSNGSTGFERGKSFEYTMGFGVGELGIHINQAFIAASQLGKTERLHKLRNIKAKWLSRELLGEESVEAYSENHRLYVGYSHHSCILFLKLVACMESFIPTDKGMTVDIVLVGNENKKKGSDISQHYEPLIKNLDDDKYILNNLGLSSIEIAFWNLEKEELKSQKYCPKNSNRKPEDEEIKIEDNSISLRYFFAKMNSNLDFSKTLEDHAKDDNQFLLLKLGKWLSMPETQTRFKQIEHTILKYRNFENLFGSYISRESRNGNQADDNYREQEEKNKGKDIYDLEWDLNNAESLDDVIKKAKELYDEAHKKFARSE